MSLWVLTAKIKELPESGPYISTQCPIAILHADS